VTKLQLGLFCLTVALATAAKPNVIFILADDLGYGDAGFNGQTKIKTPHLDQMAREGAVMTNFYAGAPVCGPSRATLMFGQHTGNCPIRGNPRWTKSGKPPELRPDDVILPKEMKRAGYHTAIIGKWGLNEDLKSNLGHPLKQGFDEFIGFNTHLEAHYHWPDFVWNGYEKVDLSDGVPKGNWKNRTTYVSELFAEKAVEYVDRRAGKAEPFFLYLNFTIPHKGYTAPASAKKPYESLGWPVIKGKPGHYEMDKDIVTAYAGMITDMDRYVGMVRNKLKEKGIDKDTLVIFTSDNGHEWGNNFFNSGGGLRGKKRNVTDGGIRMPTAVVWPSTVKPGSRIDSPLAFWDVLPTFCDVAGITPKAKTDGISFLPALRGEKQPQHKLLYWEFNEKAGPMQAIRFGKYKAIRLWNRKANAMGQVQLYDVTKDKSESKNLASSMPDLAQKAKKMIIDARSPNPEFPLELHALAKGKKK
jgi:arylsulfatase A-like enzyme